MTTPPAGITAQDIARALRKLYPRIPLTYSQQEDGTCLVGMAERIARYWGVERDPQRAAAWIGRDLPRPVEIRDVFYEGATGRTAFVTLAVSDQPRPADPGSSRGIPLYATVDEVIGDFPATRPVRALIQSALDGGLRPHLDPCPSPHGPRYRACLWGVGENPLTGVLDISETTGRFAEAWLAWGRSPETRYRHDQASVVRAAITTARDQHRAETAARGSGATSARLRNLESPAGAVTIGAQLSSAGPLPSHRRAGARTRQQHTPRQVRGR
jgi:hypothetical protein